MLSRQVPYDSNRGALPSPSRAPRLAIMGLAVLTTLTGSFHLHAQAERDSVDFLRQLVEQQSRALEELKEKVRLLEEREKLRDAAPAEQRLPTIVIDTNGTPIALVPPALLDTASASISTNRPVAQISAGSDGFSFQSADTNFVLALHGWLQVDSRTFLKDNPLSQGNDGILLRRARPIFEGTFFRDLDFRVAPDFGWPSTQLFDAFINYRFRPELQVRVGRFKGPVGLENSQREAVAPFNERSLASDLVPMLSLGAQLFGEVREGALSWAVGVYDANGDYRVPPNSAFTDDLEFGGRLFVQPFTNSKSNPLQGLGFGVGASYSDVTSNSAALPGTLGGTLPGYVTAGQQQFFAYNPLYGSVVADGAHWRVSPEAFYYRGPFGVQGEFVSSDQSVLNTGTLFHARLNQTAWQVTAQWVLTGEPASFGAPSPAHPFNPRAGYWGAWQLVARYSALDIDKGTFGGFADPGTSARSAASWSAGLNWSLNRNLRMLTSFSHTTFQGGGGVNLEDPSTLAAPATVSHQNENVLFTRIQVVF